MAFKQKGFPMHSTKSALKQVSSPMKLAEWEDHLGNVISEEDAKTLQGYQTEYDTGMDFKNQASARYNNARKRIMESDKSPEQIEYDLKILKQEHEGGGGAFEGSRGSVGTSSMTQEEFQTAGGAGEFQTTATGIDRIKQLNRDQEIPITRHDIAAYLKNPEEYKGKIPQDYIDAYNEQIEIMKNKK